MSRHTTLLLATVASCCVSLTAQITYVDADVSTNTTLANGAPYVPQTVTSSVDNEWTQRAFANGGTILSSHDATGNEDCPMLRTVITGLIPGVPHTIYTYWWGGASVNWRGRCAVDTAPPAPQLAGYNSVHFATSAFAPMTPLAFDAPLGANQTSLGLTYDALGFENTGHFANQVMLQEGNRWLYEVPLGTFYPDANGEIWVYVDDLEGQQSSSNRTWYDGVGWEWAPLPLGNGCGAPAPTIGYVGQPVTTRDFTVTLASAPASSLGMLVIGFNATSWNSLPLPLSLASFGFPGCDLNVAVDLNLFLLTDPNGAASYTVNLPQVPGLDVYWQWAALSPTGLVTTTGLETRFHR